MFKTSNKNKEESIILLLKERFINSQYPEKQSYVYEKIEELYKLNKNKGILFIKSLYEIGTWKDYLLLLNISKDQRIKKYIYNFLGKQFLYDIKNKDNPKYKPSLLVKWLPREKSNLNKKLNFIYNFRKYTYPDIEDLKQYKCKYRKEISSLCKKLDITEIKICSKNIEDINLKTITNKCINKNKTKLEENEKLKIQYQNKLYQTFIKYDFIYFFKKFSSNKLNDSEKSILRNVYLMNQFTYIKEILKQTKIKLYDTDLLLDLTKEIYDNELYLVYGLSLLTITCGNKVYINQNQNIRELDFCSSQIFNIRDKITNQVQNTNLLNHNLIKSNKKILIITTKNIKTTDKIIKWDYTIKSSMINEKKEKISIILNKLYPVKKTKYSLLLIILLIPLLFYCITFSIFNNIFNI